MGKIRVWLKDTANSALLWPGNFLHFIDQKVGIELFKIGVVLSTVYFVQGMGGGSIDTGLTKIPLLFYFKEVLHYKATDLQYFKSIAAIAWLMKPLFGFISDRWPIFGYRRKSYMILMALTASMSWFALAIAASYGYSQYVALLIMFNLSSLGYAFVDVVCDGLMVQRGQELNAQMVAEGKNPDKIKNLVNLSWFAIGISGFIASVSGGYLQGAIKAGSVSLSTVFVLAGIVPFMTAIVAFVCVKEEPTYRSAFLTAIERSKKYFLVYSIAALLVVAAFVSGAVPLAGVYLGMGVCLACYLFMIMAIYFSMLMAKGGLQHIGIKKSPEEKKASVGSRSVFKELLASRTFWMLTAFLFFWHYSPSFSSIGEYYSIEVLNFDAEFMGILGGIGNAIFPFSIVLYFGLLKQFPNVRVKTYLYFSIAVGLVFSALGYMYYMPSSYIEWVRFSLPVPPVLIVLLLTAILAYGWNIFGVAKKEAGNKAASENLGRASFVFTWIIVVPLSVILALSFSGMVSEKFQMTYRSLAVLTGVLYGYLSIASFLIPLSLAGELAPSKGEAMTYAYFMALINLSKGMIPEVSGAKMFEVLEKMLLDPTATIAQTPWFSFGVCLLAAVLAVALAWGSYKVCKKLGSKGKIAAFVAILFVAKVVAAYFIGMAVIGHLKIAATYLVQHSFIALKPIIGSADYLGKHGNTALILRYSVLIGAIFTMIATIFVYILPEKKKEDPKN